jgi:uncharacterized protein with HEPN domain
MKDPKPYLEHILQECDFLVEESNKITFEDFIKDPVLKCAFIRNLEIIDEAVKNLLGSFRDKYQEVPWKEIAGMRDKLIHEYFGVNYKIVWKTIQQEIPKLKEQVKEIMKKEGWQKL